MAFWVVFPLYMCFAAIVASYANIRLFRLVRKGPSNVHPEFDVILLCQTVFALIQLVLSVVLCPRTLSVPGYFAVDFHGPALLIGFPLQVICLAILVGLATNNVMTTAISFYHRLLVIKGEKVTVSRVIIWLAICIQPYLLVMILLMLTGDWTDNIHNAEEPNLIGYNINTVRGRIVMGVAGATPMGVLLFAIFVYWKANRVLNSFTNTASEANKKLHSSLLQALLCQAAIPCLTLFAVFAWYLNYTAFIEVFFEYFLFGVGPPILCLQALITLSSIGRYRYQRTLYNTLYLFILFMNFVFLIAICSMRVW